MAAWDIADYNYSGKSFSVLTQTNGPFQISLKDDGTKLYVVELSGDNVLEYALSTAWDVSTASFTASLDISTQETVPTSLFIGDSGSKLYISGSSQRNISEYDLSTAWDITSATFNQNADISTQDTIPRGLFFKDDGTKCFLLGDIGNDVNEYTLSTAWDISTLSFVDSFSVASQTTDVSSFCFGDSGSSFYVIHGGTIYQYDMSTAWDVSTASYVDSKDISSQETEARGIFLRGNGDNFYVSGWDNDSVYQYNAVTVISAAAAMAGISTFNAVPAIVSGAATMAGTSAFAGAGDQRLVAKGRAVDEASAGGTNAVLSVSLNSAITAPASPTGNT